MQVVLLQLPLLKDEAQVKTLVKKLGPPLVTLLSEEAEIQYVALRNINLIVQKHPEVLSYEIKVRSWQTICRHYVGSLMPGSSLDKKVTETIGLWPWILPEALSIF